MNKEAKWTLRSPFTFKGNYEKTFRKNNKKLLFNENWDNPPSNNCTIIYNRNGNSSG